jgi:NAD(P)-dependent dehydrogenase (short-subunit alcohol dehydrogenase family)
VLEGRAALITGGSRGLGLGIARAFVEAGASVMLCARDVALLEQAVGVLRTVTMLGQSVCGEKCDVTEAYQVRDLVDHVIQQFGKLDILVNNAGVYGPFGPIEDANWTDWTRAIEINLYGSVLPIRAVLPHFKAARYGKIIQVSGGGATNPLPRISAYAAAKAAVVRVIETVAEECAHLKIDANAISPGTLNTRLLDEAVAAGPDKIGEQFHAHMVRQKREGGTPVAHAAELAVFLASALSDGITGKLISALWDKWDAWPAHLDALQGSDLYTLRRITGRERGAEWGDK